MRGASGRRSAGTRANYSGTGYARIRGAPVLVTTNDVGEPSAIRASARIFEKRKWLQYEGRWSFAKATEERTAGYIPDAALALSRTDLCAEWRSGSMQSSPRSKISLWASFGVAPSLGAARHGRH